MYFNGDLVHKCRFYWPGIYLPDSIMSTIFPRPAVWTKIKVYWIVEKYYPGTKTGFIEDNKAKVESKDGNIELLYIDELISDNISIDSEEEIRSNLMSAPRIFDYECNHPYFRYMKS